MRNLSRSLDCGARASGLVGPRIRLQRRRHILSHACYTGPMAKKVITQRTLRNESGEIMRGLDRGESYIVTRNGVPVGELMPVRRREAVPAEMLLAALAGAPRIDPIRFRKDVDELIDQDPRPRA
jgi:prevent-host-death family protein